MTTAPWIGKTRDDHYNDIVMIANALAGEVISLSYVAAKTKMEFKCKEGHQFFVTPTNIKKGTWCRTCRLNPKESREKEFSILREIVGRYHGKVISEEYHNTKTKMIFECINGHRWKTQPADIKKGCWCPLCSTNKSENLVRSFFEFAFKKEFPGCSPSWLQENDTRKMILDGYCSDLAIAFEYHGIQHFEVVEHFHAGKKNQKTLEEQQARDLKVRNLCKINNIHLVEIPFFKSGYSQEDFITAMQMIFLKEFNITFSEKEIEKFRTKPMMKNKITELRTMAQKKGGDCLSVKYLTSHSKYQWKCHDGHEWEATYGSIRDGRWCPTCSNKKKSEKTFQKLKDIVKSKGGLMLSDNYTRTDAKYNFECINGHRFIKSATNILYQGGWCNTCSKNKG